MKQRVKLVQDRESQIGSMIDIVQPVWLVVCSGLLTYLLHNLLRDRLQSSTLCMKKAIAMSQQSDLQQIKCRSLH